MRTKEEQRIIDERDDVAMIASPNLWPNWPHLPVKKRKLEQPNTGVIVDIGLGNSVIVYLTNMFAFNPKAEKLAYDSPEACVDDGWVVD